MQGKIRTDKMTVAKALYWGLRAHIQIMNCYETKRKYRQKTPNSNKNPEHRHTTVNPSISLHFFTISYKRTSSLQRHLDISSYFTLSTD